MSKNCVARLNVGGRKIALLGVHFLSRPLDTSRLDRRQAQADAALSIAMQLLVDEEFEVVVLGDFNDFDGNADSLDHDNNSPITTVMSQIRGMDPTDSSDDLVNAASLIAKEQRFTSHFDKNGNSQVEAPGELSSIDHILLSPQLAADVTSATIPHDHDPTKLTDHFPVVVRLAMDTTNPPPAAEVSFRMVALLPNPEGDENLLEQAFIANEGQEEGRLDGWSLRD